MSEDESTSLSATQAVEEDFDMEDTIECDICGTEMPLRYSTLCIACRIPLCYDCQKDIYCPDCYLKYKGAQKQ